MIKKRGKKSLVNNGDEVKKAKKENKVEKAKKENKVEKAKKEEINSVDKLLEKITVGTVTDAMVEHKWLVAKTIAVYIIGINAWDKLSEMDQYIVIKRVNEIKFKTPGLM